MANKKFDMLNFMLEFEGGWMSNSELVYGFQHLINTGKVWTIYGGNKYIEMADFLIEKGICRDSNDWTPEQAVEQLKKVEMLDNEDRL